MTPDVFNKIILQPAIAVLEPLLPGISWGPPARVMLLSISGQESGWKERRQIGVQYYPQKIGARSFWQFESTWGGPVALNDVLQSASGQIKTVCDYLSIPCDEYSLYEACAWNDILATAMARLLLWLDPKPLPKLDQRDEAWNYYQRNWKPGAPHPEAWPTNYGAALALVK